MRAQNQDEIAIKSNGLVVSWRTVFAMIVALLGGGSGGFAMVEVATEGKVDEKIQDVIEVEKVRHTGVQLLLDDHAKILKKHDDKISRIDQGIEQIQQVQHRSVSRDEARRITETIESRVAREREYDRLVDLNLKRLRKGDDPCGNMECSN